jgi:tetratricopeptide (TPR) repeat protein
VSGEEVWAALRRGEALLAARRPAEARRLAMEAAASAPGDPSPLLLAARAELDLDDPVAAERTAAAAIGLDPERPSGHRVLATAVLNQAMGAVDIRRHDLAERAVAASREALRLAPDDLAGLLVAAEAAAWSNRVGEAAGYADRAVRMAPGSEVVWYVRARVARISGDLSGAETAAREALRLAPDHYGAGNLLGLILRAKGDEAAALRQFAASAAIDPLASAARSNLTVGVATRLGLATFAVTSPLLVLAVTPVGPLGALLAWIVGARILAWQVGRSPRVTRWVEHRALAVARRDPDTAASRWARAGRALVEVVAAVAVVAALLAAFGAAAAVPVATFVVVLTVRLLLRRRKANRPAAPPIPLPPNEA